jgi:hypothetical protein
MARSFVYSQRKRVVMVMAIIVSDPIYDARDHGRHGMHARMSFTYLGMVFVPRHKMARWFLYSRGNGVARPGAPA